MKQKTRTRGMILLVFFLMTAIPVYFLPSGEALLPSLIPIVLVNLLIMSIGYLIAGFLRDLF